MAISLNVKQCYYSKNLISNLILKKVYSQMQGVDFFKNEKPAVQQVSSFAIEKGKLIIIGQKIFFQPAFLQFLSHLDHTLFRH